MVEVNEKLYVSAEAFFTQLAESIAYDVCEATGKKIRPKQLHKGYSYHKKLKNKVGRKGDVKVVITEFSIPTSYCAEFHSYGGVNKLGYHIEKIDTDCIGVTYMEDFIGNTKMANMNFRIMNAIYKNRAKKKARRMLRAMETYIKENGNKVGTTTKESVK